MFSTIFNSNRPPFVLVSVLPWMQFPTLQLKSPISTSFSFLWLASEILFSIALYSFFRSWLGVLDSWGAYIVPIRSCSLLLSSLMNKVWPTSLYSSTWTVIDLSLFSQAINIPHYHWYCHF